MNAVFVRWLASDGGKHTNRDPKREDIVADAKAVVQTGDPAAMAVFLRRLEIKRHLREVDMLYAAWLREGRTNA